MRVILIGENGNNMGQFDLDAAKNMAKSQNKDLVLVNAKNNVYRIVDSGKLRYEQKQKAKDQRAQKRTHKIKEIQLKPATDMHDIGIKMAHIREFLKKGLKTKVVMKFRNREITHAEIGSGKMQQMLSTLESEGICKVDGSPKFEGKNLIVFLIPIIKE